MAKKVEKKAQLTGYRRVINIVFAYTAWGFSILGLVQIFLAGVGAFGVQTESAGFEMHEILGHLLGWLSVILLIFALIARRSAAIIISAIVLVLLTNVIQNILAHAGFTSAWLGGLHAVTGIIAVMLAGKMGDWATGWTKR